MHQHHLSFFSKRTVVILNWLKCLFSKEGHIFKLLLYYIIFATCVTLRIKRYIRITIFTRVNTLPHLSGVNKKIISCTSLLLFCFGKTATTVYTEALLLQLPYIMDWWMDVILCWMKGLHSYWITETIHLTVYCLYWSLPNPTDLFLQLYRNNSQGSHLPVSQNITQVAQRLLSWLPSLQHLSPNTVTFPNTYSCPFLYQGNNVHYAFHSCQHYFMKCMKETMRISIPVHYMD